MNRHRVTDDRATDLVSSLSTMRTDFEDGARTTYSRMTECEAFKVGRQWDDVALSWNEKHRKDSLTINQILPTVMQMVGQEIQNPRDVTIANMAGPAATKARLLTALIKHSLDMQETQRKKTQAFDDGLTTGRGWLGIDYRYDEDPEHGDLEVMHHDPFLVLLDPACKSYDLNSRINGAKCVIVDTWVPKDAVHASYKDRVRDIDGASYGDLRQSNGISGWVSNLFGQLFSQGAASTAYDVADDYRTSGGIMDERNNKNQKNSYRVSSYWWREWRPGVVLLRPDRPGASLKLYDRKHIAEAKEMVASSGNGARLVEKAFDGSQIVVPVLHRALMIGNVLLCWLEDPFDGIMDIPLIRFSPYFIHGREFGIIENLIGPQKTINTGWSHVINITKKMANASWKVKGGTQESKEWLRTYGTEDGEVIDQSKFGGLVEKLEQTQFPSQFAAIMERSVQHIPEIAGIRREMPGFDAEQMSGRAILAKQRASETGTAMPFANYDYSMELMGTLVARHIMAGKLYSEDEIRAICDESELIDPELYEEARTVLMAQLEKAGQINSPVPPDPQRLAKMSGPEQQRMITAYMDHKKIYNTLMIEVEEQAKDIAVDMLLDDMSKLRWGKWAARTSLSQASATYRQEKASELLDLHRVLIDSGQPGIPRDILIKGMDVPYKDEILAADQAAQAAQAQLQAAASAPAPGPAPRPQQQARKESA